MTGLIVRMIIIAIVALASFFSSYRASSYFDTATGLAYFPAESQTARQQLSASENMSNRSNTRTRTCIPRTYPYPIRYYGLSSPDYPPPFLRNATYINGEHPRILSDEVKYRRKLCGNDSIQNQTMDGTNPSIIAVERLRSVDGFHDWVQAVPNSAFLVSLTFKNNHQCDLSTNTQRYMPKLPGRQRKKEVDLLLVDSDMGTLLQTTITDEASVPVPMDDAKLFLHSKSIWVSYTRHDPQNRGMQLISRLKLEYTDHRLYASIGEPTFSVCCGRNMAAFEAKQADTTATGTAAGSTKLQLVTWLDPLFVGSVDITQMSTGDALNLLDPQNPKVGDSLLLHGTTGSMVYVPALKEYVGIGHYHRGKQDDGSQESLYGHHYTHVFFTISAYPPYRIKRLSNEFVLESFGHNGDADIVQFSSGLEMFARNGVDLFLIAYGINDCEAATAVVSAETVYSMLEPVRKNTPIHQMMKSYS